MHDTLNKLVSSRFRQICLLYQFLTITAIIAFSKHAYSTLYFFFLGVFNESLGNISDKYFLELTPSSYVFGTIWPIIFLWTIVGKIYLVVSLFLPDNKSPVKIIPAFTPMVSNKIRFNCSATLPALSW